VDPNIDTRIAYMYFLLVVAVQTIVAQLDQKGRVIYRLQKPRAEFSVDFQRRADDLS